MCARGLVRPDDRAAATSTARRLRKLGQRTNTTARWRANGQAETDRHEGVAKERTGTSSGSEGRRMIDLYYWTTPNGHKITMFLEEAQVPYRILPVRIGRGEQFAPEFLRISPNNRIPAIVDTEPGPGQAELSLFESGAILLYLAEKTGQLIPRDLRGRADVLQWLFWQVGGLGPMTGQNHHFIQYAPTKIEYAIDRYVKETSRLYAI